MMRGVPRIVPTMALGASLLAAAAFAPSAGAAPSAKTSAPTHTDTTQLKPGHFIWAPNLAPKGPMLMTIGLKAQQAFVYRNGVRIGVTTVSTGKKGKTTPTGVFTILQKKEKHNSNLYNNASMPFMQRLTWDGIALHAGDLPGYPASHGCVRLPHAFAKKLFAETSLGMTVVITGEAEAPHQLNGGGILVPVTTSGAAENRGPRLGENEAYQWRPEAAPSGPVTLVLSTHDQRLLVLRNGKVIGKGRVRVPPGHLAGGHVLEFAGFDPRGKGRWIYVDVPGGGERAGQALDVAALEALQAPAEYLDHVRGVLKPGATLLITDGGIRSGGAGKRMTIVDG
jgi:hypothetical protein